MMEKLPPRFMDEIVKRMQAEIESGRQWPTVVVEFEWPLEDVTFEYRYPAPERP